jgi:hypothetical protein
MENEETTFKQFNRSGFPFQLRIEHEIESSKTQHNWEVASREHPWRRQDTDSSGFIDIVLRNNAFPGDRLVIDCKRVKSDDSSQLQWLFLLPDPNPGETRMQSCLEVFGAPPTSSSHGGWQDYRIWENVQVSPSSFQSEFCVLSGDEPKRQPILESHCANLLESLDGLAGEEVSISKSRKSRTGAIFIFPAIITNAKITVCQFKASEIKLTDGTLDRSSLKLFEVPFIRFRKSLVGDFPKGEFNNLKDANRARERTVLIINSERLVEFLQQWNVTSTRFKIEEYVDRF